MMYSQGQLCQRDRHRPDGSWPSAPGGISSTIVYSLGIARRPSTRETRCGGDGGKHETDGVGVSWSRKGMCHNGWMGGRAGGWTKFWT